MLRSREIGKVRFLSCCGGHYTCFCAIHGLLEIGCFLAPGAVIISGRVTLLCLVFSSALCFVKASNLFNGSPRGGLLFRNKILIAHGSWCSYSPTESRQLETTKPSSMVDAEQSTLTVFEIKIVKLKL